MSVELILNLKRMTRKLGLLLAAGVIFSLSGILTSCDDDPELQGTEVTFRFSHNFDGVEVDNSTFNQFNYINENEDTLSISRLRYLISDIMITEAGGDVHSIEGYQLVDVTAGTGLTLSVTDDLPQATYTGLSFTFGFDEADNLDNAYPDLNVATWNWPVTLGGGYHFMQMEGMFIKEGINTSYAYHHGTAMVSEGVFEQNYFETELGGFTLDKQFAEIEIQMDISEWYKDPNPWDLSVYNMMLMPNYNAQKMMQANGATVFHLGAVSQND